MPHNKEQTLLTRIKMRHTTVTYKHLEEGRPRYQACNKDLTIGHIKT